MGPCLSTASTPPDVEAERPGAAKEQEVVEADAPKDDAPKSDADVEEEEEEKVAEDFDLFD